MEDKYKYYLLDLGYFIREKAFEARKAKDERRTDYEVGRLMGYHEVISLMQSQAASFDIPLDELGLADLNPEVDLL